MQSSNDPRLIKCVDGLAFSFQILEYSHGELYPACCRISSDPRAVVVALAHAWSFIDSVHRVREIAQATPGLSARNPERRTLLAATEVAEVFRHYIQHLRSELVKRPVNPFPVWGSLSWVDEIDPQLAHMEMAGAVIGETSFSGCVFDVVKHEWVSKVCLGVASRSFNFDPILAACLRFRDFVIPWALSIFEPGVTVKSEIPIVSTRFVMAKRGGS